MVLFKSLVCSTSVLTYLQQQEFWDRICALLSVVLEESRRNFPACCTDGIVPGSSAGVSYNWNRSGIEWQYFSSHEVVTWGYLCQCHYWKWSAELAAQRVLVTVWHCFHWSWTTCLLLCAWGFCTLVCLPAPTVHLEVSYLSFLSIFKFVMISLISFQFISPEFTWAEVSWTGPGVDDPDGSLPA